MDVAFGHAQRGLHLRGVDISQQVPDTRRTREVVRSEEVSKKLWIRPDGLADDLDRLPFGHRIVAEVQFDALEALIDGGFSSAHSLVEGVGSQPGVVRWQSLAVSPAEQFRD